MTRDESTTKDGTISPPVVTPSLDHPFMSPNHNDGSPSQPPAGSQTQPFSQMIYPPPPFAYEVDDEEAEGVWGYLVPIDGKSNKFGTLVLRERQTCAPKSQSSSNGKSSSSKPGKSTASDKNGDKSKENSSPSKGYLIGRHPECGKFWNYQMKYHSTYSCTRFSDRCDNSFKSTLPDIL
jgi:serine/threonine-protein kinase Chk2